MDHFSHLYQSIADLLSGEFGAPVTFSRDFALPGFHIWLAEGICTRPVASVHFDLQYQHLKWPPEDGPDFTQIISFTLPLKLPLAGGGINAWDLEYDEFLEARERGYAQTIPEIQRFKTMTLIPYSRGEMMVHSGHMLHQIAPSQTVVEGDERLTLQGHGVLCRSGWRLYW